MSAGLEPVLWIGGGQGAGKSTAAWLLARRHGLRLYFVDAFTYSHIERAAKGDYPVMNRFTAMSLDERWVEPTPEQMVEQFLDYSRERFALILEDLRALPAEPAIVAEGPQLLPELVEPLLGSPEAAVWLIPSNRLQQGLLDTRPSATPGLTSDAKRARTKMDVRNELLAASIRAAALERGLTVAEIDAYQDAADVVDERLGALARTQGVSDPDAVRQLRRDANLMVLDQIKRYLASNEAPPEPEPGGYPFGCECRRPGCFERREVEVSDYEQLVREGRFVSAH